MKIEYSEHLKTRIHLRNIDWNLPRQILESATDHYFDHETGYMIAIKQVYLYNRLRNVMVAYTEQGDTLKAITIHPLKEGQIENRIRNGRWRNKDERI